MANCGSVAFNMGTQGQLKPGRFGRAALLKLGRNGNVSWKI